MASSIISVVFSALAFVGVFAVLFVLPWYYLMAVVMAVVFGAGFLLDRVAKFWSAQATVATVRNQYLVDHLYQKEALNLSEITLPTLRTLLSLSKEGHLGGRRDPSDVDEGDSPRRENGRGPKVDHQRRREGLLGPQTASSIARSPAVAFRRGTSMSGWAIARRA